MTQPLEKAFDEISKLPEQEQDFFAHWLLDEISSEHRCDKAFSQSQDVLSQFAKEALAEYQVGKTKLLDPDDL